MATAVSVSPLSVSTSRSPEQRQQQYQGLKAFDTMLVELLPGFSVEEADVVIRAIYRQVLGNTYVMESERLEVPESQLKRGELSVREFIRCLAKSLLYRTRFFDSCYRYRAIEVNFKHLLGRAPSNFQEMKYHSAILDNDGFDAEIDSYLDSDEYQQTFGENVVPYYRGYKTQTGQPLLGFTNMLQLLPSTSSSDKDPASSDRPQLIKAIIFNRPYGINRPRDAKDILREVFKPQLLAQVGAQSLQADAERKVAAEQALRQTLQQQSQEIERLQKQLAELRPLASFGASQLKQTWGSSILSNGSETDDSLQQQIEAQATQLSQLQEQLADAQRYALIGEARLNKWRSRLYNG